MMIEIEQKDFETLCICAIRYCQGRQTYMPSMVQRICKEHLDAISNGTLKAMLNDCDFQEQLDLYGDARIDKPGWLTWKDDLKKEAQNRSII